MEKRISFNQFQSVKLVAKSCNPVILKRERIKKQIEELQAELQSCNTQIDALEAGIKSIIGFRAEDLVKKVIESNTDKNGNTVKVTKYVPTDMVTYDKEAKQYVITYDEQPTAFSATDETKEFNTINI